MAGDGGVTQPQSKAAVLAANQAFYDAFESKDFDRVSELWEHSDRVQCTHPGWSVLRSWAEVGGAWKALIDGPQELQFVLTNERVEVSGDIGWVTVDENILGAGQSGTVSALNMFARQLDGSWKMISHHGSQIMMRS